MTETAPGGPTHTTAQIAGHIRQAAWAIIDHYDAALAAPRPPDDGDKGKGASIPDPMPVHVADARRAAHADLLHYCRAIQFVVTDIEGGQITTRLDGDNVEQLARFVITWALHLVDADRPEGEACKRDLTGHGRRLRNIANGMAPKRFKVGLCPEHLTSDMGERVPCDGSLRAVLRNEDDEKASGVECTTSRDHSWTTSEWLMLGSRVRGEECA